MESITIDFTLGNSYFLASNNKKAKKIFQDTFIKSKKIIENENAKKICALSNRGIGLIKYLTRELQQALESYSNSLDIHSELRDKNAQADDLVSIGTILSELNELRKAIERGEFQLYYQPQFYLRKVEVIGFEALLRWNHSELGFISPEKFISELKGCITIKDHHIDPLKLKEIWGAKL